MSTRLHHGFQSIPVKNYSSAIAKAVEWLGDRYLLAKPINSVSSGDAQAGVRKAVQRFQRHTDM
jgi:hypothetical protein